MVHLCDKCFPNYEDCEVFTIVPFSPCELCGAYDDRYNGGTTVNVMPGNKIIENKDGSIVILLNKGESL